VHVDETPGDHAMKTWAIFSTLFLIATLATSADIAADSTRSDDWITVNKDYSSQRYVSLDQIIPNNVDQLKEICEIRLNEPIMFRTGLLKIGRTLYVDTADQSVAGIYLLNL
jgi:glucose dehydrogenase